MKTFLIVETHEVTKKYQVTADSEDAAKDKVMNDEVQAVEEEKDNFEITSCHELPKAPPNCPICHGERELNGNGGYICHFCGREMSV